MFFPVSGVEVSPFIPPLVAFVISFFASMGGISGAFLLLPFQMSFLGYTHPSVSATNQMFNIVAIPSGVYRYWREGRLVWPLVWVVVIGTIPGVFIGAVIRVVYLPDATAFKLFAAGVLLFISIKMLMSMRKKIAKVQAKDDNLEEKIKNNILDSRFEGKVTEVTELSLSRFSFRFYDNHYNVSLLGIVCLTFVVGIVGGIYGIGGGAIIAPFFVTFLNLPIYIVAGATLMGTFVTSIVGVLFYQMLSVFTANAYVAPDFFLGLLFGLGGMFGMYFGARLQKYIPAKLIKYILAFTMLFTSIKYVLDYFSVE